MTEATAPERLTAKHIQAALDGLRKAGSAAWDAWFIGIGWPEGRTYCANPKYVRKTAIPAFLQDVAEDRNGNRRAIWFLYVHFGRG